MRARCPFVSIVPPPIRRNRPRWRLFSGRDWSLPSVEPRTQFLLFPLIVGGPAFWIVPEFFRNLAADAPDFFQSFVTVRLHNLSLRAPAVSPTSVCEDRAAR